MNFCPNCGSRIKKGESSCPSCGSASAHTDTRRGRSLVDSFPFPNMRPSQERVLRDVETTLSTSRRFVVLEAPVGFGKSAIAAALCRHLGSAYLLTSTKQLQSQYSLDFGFPIVTGKSNFTCLVPTTSGRTVPCSKGRCEADWKLSECPHYLTFEEYDEHKRGECGRDSKCRRLKDGRLCPYYEQKCDAFRDDVFVANYPFFLAELSHTEDVSKRKVLVCDEAHDLERQMVGFGAFTLRKSTLDAYARLGSDVLIPDMGIEDATAWIGTLEKAERMLEEFVDDSIDGEDSQDRVASCRNSLDSLESFLNDLKENPANWIVDSVRRSASGGEMDGMVAVEEVVFKPLEVGAYTARLFEAADTVLLMSATVSSSEVFCRSLGIPESEATFIRVSDSSFPVENRPIYALNAVHLNKSTMDASLGRLTEVVDGIMMRHSGEKGIVHTTSYAQARYIMDHVSDASRARLSSTENVSSRADLLRSHRTTDESVLISPSLYQGVDLKDDLSRFQILVKVPYPDLSERRTRVKLERDPEWYDWQTALRLVQTYGRSVRSETDHAVTYVLDSNFTSFLGRHRELFPEYFLEALANPIDL